MSNACSSVGASDKRIAVDVMGADFGHLEVLNGVALAMKSVDFAEVVLVGDESIISPAIKEVGLERHSNVSIFHASQVIEMHEKATQTLKQKKDASMFRAIELVKDGKADAVLSCGNTGSLMAGSTLKLRPMSGIERPALASIIPSRHGSFVLIDVGANPESKTKYLVHNAILGSHFASAIFANKRPRIGLLTIGTEEGKGNEFVQEAHEYLKRLNGEHFNYHGVIEGFQVFNNEVDVVVCDGFVGNILLKTWESLFDNLKQYLKDEFRKNYIRVLGGMFSRGVFKNMKAHFSPDDNGGAPLLGLNGWVFKAHGSSRASSIAGAIKMCAKCLELNDFSYISRDIDSANAILDNDSIT